MVPAGNVRATVIMDREESAWKMQLILNDAENYWISKRDPTLKIENKITETFKHFQKDGHNDDWLCDSLIPPIL